MRRRAHSSERAAELADQKRPDAEAGDYKVARRASQVQSRGPERVVCFMRSPFIFVIRGCSPHQYCTQWVVG
jgi:hypothetical protein